MTITSSTRVWLERRRDELIEQLHNLDNLTRGSLVQTPAIHASEFDVPEGYKKVRPSLIPGENEE